eukprot:scaffold323_cov74-Skeletonema_dohrnii-CCMP3373.AAC.3
MWYFRLNLWFVSWSYRYRYLICIWVIKAHTTVPPKPPDHHPPQTHHSPSLKLVSSATCNNTSSQTVLNTSADEKDEEM